MKEHLYGVSVVLAGGSGLIGRLLIPHLLREGAVVTVLSRRSIEALRDEGLTGVTVKPWEEAASALEGAFAVVNLAGENLGAAPWTPARKSQLLESRVGPTRFLTHALSGLLEKPKVFLNASAIGYYGHREARVDETSGPGQGFLSELCEAWELAADEAALYGARVVKLRTSLVLSRQGGVLPLLVRVVKWGVAAPLGDGRQGMSWIHEADLVRLILEALVNPMIQGPLNAVAPESITNTVFMATLCRHFRRPLWPIPAWMSRMGLSLLKGEMGKTLLLEGANVEPRKALDAAFAFEHPTLEGALKALYSRSVADVKRVA